MTDSRVESEERERRADEMEEREGEAKRGASQEGFDMNDTADREAERRDRSPRSNSNSPPRREESQGERSRNEGGAGEEDCNGGERRSGSQQRSTGTVRTRRGGTQRSPFSLAPACCVTQRVASANSVGSHAAVLVSPTEAYHSMQRLW